MFFRIRLGTAEATISEQKISKDHTKKLAPFLKFTFDNEKPIKTQSQKGAHPKWELQQQFFYKGNSVQDLTQKRLLVECVNHRKKDIVLGTAEMYLFTILTGCVWQDIPLVDSNKQAIGSVKFEIEMEEVKRIIILFHKVAIRSLTPYSDKIDPESIHIRYFHSLQSNKKKVSLETDLIEQVSDKKLKYGLFPLAVRTTIQDNLLASIDLDIVTEKKTKAELVVGSTAKIEFGKYFCGKKQLVKFQEDLVRKNDKVGLITGYLSFMNLPTYSQLVGGVRTTEGNKDGVHYSEVVENPYGVVSSSFKPQGVESRPRSVSKEKAMAEKEALPKENIPKRSTGSIQSQKNKETTANNKQALAKLKERKNNFQSSECQCDK